MQQYEPEIDKLTLVPSDGGKFEVEVNDTLIYSKVSLGRHAQAGEVSGLLRQMIEKGRR